MRLAVEQWVGEPMKKIVPSIDLSISEEHGSFGAFTKPVILKSEFDFSAANLFVFGFFPKLVLFSKF